MEKSESIKELATALNRVQATLQAAKQGSENPFFKSTYADLLAVWDACRKTLTDNGLSVSQIADMDSEGRAVLETVLMHTSGEWIKGRLPLASEKAGPQAQGSALTYARRYSLSAIIGLCTEKDDDAEGATSRGKPKAEPKGHWCSTHKTPFFKKGKMKSYAHPIKDEAGKDTGEWCYEHKEEVNTGEQEFEDLDKSEPKPEPEILIPSEAKTSAPKKLGFIEGQWFRETLAKIQNNKGDAWSDDKLLNYLTQSYKVEATTIEGAINKLSKEAADHFVKKMQEALDSIDKESQRD